MSDRQQLVSNKKVAGAVGIGSILGLGGLSIAVAGHAPTTPEKLITWSTAARTFIEQAGMPGIILVLCCLWVSTVYYYEQQKIPRMYGHHQDLRAAWIDKEKELEGSISDLHEAALNYRDQVLEYMRKMTADNIEATTMLRTTLQELKEKINGTA